MARTPKVVEDRREQIIDAAMQVFAQKGYLRATNKDIARTAGITPGLIYHYFENKEAVLKAVIEGRSPARILRTLPENALTQSPIVFLPFLIKQVLDIVEGENFVQVLHVLVPELVHHPEIASGAVQVLQQALQFMSTYLQNQMTRGVMRQADALLTAQVLFGSMMGFVFRRQFLRDPVALAYTHEQIAASIVDTVLSGLLPR